MLADDPELVGMIVEKIGRSLFDYYAQIVGHDSVGAIMVNDDWGFNTQTMLSTADMEKYIFPWHRKIVDVAHKANKSVMLHSCGNLEAVHNVIIDDIKFDAKHSYEDKIVPVEEMYDVFKGKIAVLGGLDIDFVCRKSVDEVYERSLNMLKKTNCEGYALGTGNSIPDYLADEQYFAMILAALEN